MSTDWTKKPEFETVTHRYELADLVSIRVDRALDINSAGYTEEGEMTQRFQAYLADCPGFETGMIHYEQELHEIIGTGEFKPGEHILIESANYKVRPRGPVICPEHEGWISVPFEDFQRMGFPRTIRRETTTSITGEEE